MSKLEDYFFLKNINVSYDTLSSNETMIRAYLNEFQHLVNSARGTKSETVKHDCYNTLYNLDPRPKFTGFEKLSEIDHKFRRKLKEKVLLQGLDWQKCIEIPHKENIIVYGLSYKELLKSKVKEFKNPFLYLSGGLDSELVALAMIDAGVEFTPVIFSYIDKDGNVLNDFDLNYAYKFCKKYFLTPIVKTLDIEELWKEKWFFEKALETQIYSPQILTHLCMIEIMEHEFPGIDHVFGGEVRFQSNITRDDVKLNLITLGKNTFLPTLWDGQTYTTTYSNYGQAKCYLYLNYPPAVSASWGTFDDEGWPTPNGGGGFTSRGIWWFAGYDGKTPLGSYGLGGILFSSTLNTLSFTGTQGSTIRWSSLGENITGWDNPAVNSTTSLYYNNTTPQGPAVYADGILSNVNITTNWTFVIKTPDNVQVTTSITLRAFSHDVF